MVSRNGRACAVLPMARAATVGRYARLRVLAHVAWKAGLAPDLRQGRDLLEIDDHHSTITREQLRCDTWDNGGRLNLPALWKPAEGSAIRGKRGGHTPHVLGPSRRMPSAIIELTCVNRREP